MSTFSIEQMRAYHPFVAELDGIVAAFCDRHGWHIETDHGVHPGRTLRKGGNVEGFIRFELARGPDQAYPHTFRATVPFDFQRCALVLIGADLYQWWEAGGTERRTVPFHVLHQRLPEWLEESAAVLSAVSREAAIADGWHTDRAAPFTWSRVEAFNVWPDDRRAMPPAV